MFLDAQTDTNAFLNVEDAKNATLNHFPNAKEFYEAAQLDIYNYEDYQLVRICGIKDKTLFNQIQEEGFVAGFEEYKSYIRNEDAEKEFRHSQHVTVFRQKIKRQNTASNDKVVFFVKQGFWFHLPLFGFAILIIIILGLV